MDAVLRYLECEAQERKHMSLSNMATQGGFPPWTLHTRGSNQPTQKGGKHCGIFLCLNADFLADNIAINSGTYSLSFITEFARLKIGTDILRTVLTYP